jgi:hypothetical protein
MSSTPNARKAAARDLAARTGLKYTAALAIVTPSDPPRQPRARWILTDFQRAFFAGEGWHGGHPGVDLYDWVDGLKTSFECDWCAEDADATAEDCTLQLIMAGYDPDLSPTTGMLTVKKHHARCRPTGPFGSLDSIVWCVPVDIPTGPYEVALPATAKPDVAGEFAITAVPLLPDDPDVPAMLVLLATLTEDHGVGAEPWHNELQLALEDAGFTHHDVEHEGDPGWSVRIVTDYPAEAPRWLAVRTTPPRPGVQPHHLFLGALDLSDEWVARARAAQQVLVCAGVTFGDDMPEVNLFGLLQDGTLLARLLPVQP